MGDFIGEKQCVTHHICDCLRTKMDLLEKVAALATGFCTATEQWNEEVEKIVGKQPKTGIPVSELKQALTNFKKWEAGNG